LKKEVEAWYSDGKQAVIMEFDPAKNIYGSLYHVREPMCVKMEAPLRDILDAVSSWKQRKLFCKVCMAFESL
jgi:hypothetical protein